MIWFSARVDLVSLFHPLTFHHTTRTLFRMWTWTKNSEQYPHKTQSSKEPLNSKENPEPWLAESDTTSLVSKIHTWDFLISVLPSRPRLQLLGLWNPGRGLCRKHQLCSRLSLDRRGLELLRGIWWLRLRILKRLGRLLDPPIKKFVGSFVWKNKLVFWCRTCMVIQDSPD